MSMFHGDKTKFFSKWQFITAAIFFIFILLLVLSYLSFELIYQNKIYPGAHIGSLNLGGQTIEQAKKNINKKVDQINQNGILFYYQDYQTTIWPLVVSMEADLAYETVNFDIEKTVASVYGFGRSANFFQNLMQKAAAFLYTQNFGVFFNINENEIKKSLADSFSGHETPAQNAQLVVQKNIYSSEFRFDIKEEKFGQAIDYSQGIVWLKNKLLQLDNSPIILQAKIDYPIIYKQDCLNVDAKAQNILAIAPLILRYNEQELFIEKDQLADWLAIKINPVPEATDKIIIGLNPDKVTVFLNERIAPEIKKPPLDAKFEVKDGRVMEFQASQDGIELNTEASCQKIEYELINNKNNKVELAMRELKSAIHTEDINNLGIKEIVGIGESNFVGSPKNRRHNISVGAAALNGLLIKPGEEFSLNNALGEINGETGYLPELVIKDNKTTPEFGGGLCQIGTTIFRAALSTGLPITMRRNHSYRVTYYEPAGTDATIYSPWPDLKFINDTGNNILIQSRIEGNNLYFDFWGTKDGRLVEKTESKIYNVVKPGPTKIVETLDLKPGEKKCTEKAHNGADAYFDYKVTYPNSEIKETRFSSHYVPWREVCLVGVEKLSEPSADSTTASQDSKQETTNQSNTLNAQN